MEDSTLPFFENEIKDRMQGIIKVIGVGGGGCNAVRNMWNEQIGSSRVWYERLKGDYVAKTSDFLLRRLKMFC